MRSDERFQDAYVFVSSGSRPAIEALRDLWEKGGIRYVARPLSGAFGAVAFLEAPLPEERPGDEEADEREREERALEVLYVLRDRIGAVRDAVNPGASVGVALQIGPAAPTRWSEKQPVGAYVRIRAEAGRAMEVFDAVNSKLPDDTYVGSALVIGDWDILLEIGARTLNDLKRKLLYEVASIPGIAWTDTAIVINDRRRPASPSRW